MNRRELLRGLALGGAVIAGELWIPGQKLISIPKRAPLLHTGNLMSDDRIDAIRYVSSERNPLTAAQFRTMMSQELNEIFLRLYDDLNTAIWEK